MNYPGDKSRNYNNGDVDSYLGNDQPISISHDASAPKLLLPIPAATPPASGHQDVASDQLGIVRCGPN